MLTSWWQKCLDLQIYQQLKKYPADGKNVEIDRERKKERERRRERKREEEREKERERRRERKRRCERERDRDGVREREYKSNFIQCNTRSYNFKKQQMTCSEC